MKTLRLWLPIALVAANSWLLLLEAQPNITNVEYFVDTDPGFGNGNVISIVPSTTLSEQTLNLNTSSLLGGLHTLVIRAKDATGAWGLNYQLLFVKPFSASNVLPTLTAAEYFIDNDPGLGNANAISGISGTYNISDAVFNLNTSGLSHGLHTLVIRAKDATGAWGLNHQLLFVKPFSAPNVLPTLTAAEYFIDSDPGLGNANAISGISGNSNISDAVFNLNTSGLSEGLHTLVIRSKDATGTWGLNNQLLFVKPVPNPIGAAPLITKVEYFIDKDPGIGKAMNIAIGTPLTNFQDATLNSELDSLLGGPHALFIRAQDALGNWSMTNRIDFTIQTYCPGSPIQFTSNISGANYQWQTDGSGTFTNISDDANYSGTNTSILQLTIPTSFNRYQYRCLVNGNYSDVYKLRIGVNWAGLMNTAWENTGNWDCGVLPDANTDVLIGTGKALILNSNSVIKSLRISPGSSIKVKTGVNLQIAGK